MELCGRALGSAADRGAQEWRIRNSWWVAWWREVGALSKQRPQHHTNQSYRQQFIHRRGWHGHAVGRAAGHQHCTTGGGLSLWRGKVRIRWYCHRCVVHHLAIHHVVVMLVCRRAMAHQRHPKIAVEHAQQRPAKTKANCKAQRNQRVLAAHKSAPGAPAAREVLREPLFVPAVLHTRLNRQCLGYVVL